MPLFHDLSVSMKSVQPSSVYIVNIMSTIAIVVINAVEIAAVQASLLLRCGDIEVNPGPLEKEGKIADCKFRLM